MARTTYTNEEFEKAFSASNLVGCLVQDALDLELDTLPVLTNEEVPENVRKAWEAVDKAVLEFLS